MKLKKLLPIATISGIAAIVMPFATSCATKAIRLTEFVSEDEDLDNMSYLKNPTPLSLTKDTSYSVEASGSNWTDTTTDFTTNNWMFYIIDSTEKMDKAYKMSEFEVKIDGQKLTLSDDLFQLKTGEFYYDDDSSYPMLIGYQGDFTKNSKFEINVTLAENAPSGIFGLGFSNFS